MAKHTTLKHCRSAILFALAGAALITAACAEGNLVAPLPTLPPPPSPAAPPPPTYTEVKALFVQYGCAKFGCHFGPFAPAGLNLSPTVSYANLYNAKSTQQPSRMRVLPGDPDNSYLVMKLEGTGSPSRMKPGGPYLTPDEIKKVRDWIKAGALDN